MATLDIITQKNGENNVLLTAEGCHLRFFVIFENSDDTIWEPVDPFEGDNGFYQMPYYLEPNTEYEFHVYDGQEPKDFRGKMKFCLNN